MKSKSEINRHLQTAKLLIEGIEETIETWGVPNGGFGYSYINSTPEHSRDSVVRRCVQIRQELLQVMKGLQNYD